MGKPVTVRQAQALMSMFESAVDWDHYDRDFIQKIIDEGPRAKEEFKRFISSGGRILPLGASWKWPVWKTVTVGSGPKTADDFRRTFKKMGNKISDWGNDILGDEAFTVNSEETTIDLVCVTVRDLGFTLGAFRHAIYYRAQELGFEILPAEVGPRLRLAYQDQPMGEWIQVGMRPITDSDGYPRVFRIEHDGDGLWLGGGCGSRERFLVGPDRVWVFGRRK